MDFRIFFPESGCNLVMSLANPSRKKKKTGCDLVPEQHLQQKQMELVHSSPKRNTTNFAFRAGVPNLQQVEPLPAVFDS